MVQISFFNFQNPTKKLSFLTKIFAQSAAGSFWQQIKQWIQQGDFGENIILAGDLNDVPGSELILTCSSFCDNSTNDDQYETFYSVNPDRQLDYIFSCPKERLSFKNSRVIDEPIASDHRPLISDIIVP